MRATNRLARYCWAAFTLGALGLHAQDSGFSSALKLRGLLSSTAKSQGLTNGVFGHGMALGYGFGLEAGYGIGPGKIVGELGYNVLNGDAMLGDLSQMQKSGNAVDIAEASSFESRKNKIDGMSVRLGYESTLSGDLSWRAGLQFGGAKFTHQVIGNINGTNGGPAFSESYIAVKSKSSMAPSPFGGVTYAIDANSALEFGVLLLQYTSLDYRHIAASNSGHDTIDEKKRILPNFEFAYVFRF